jgi:probable DNA repair protein
VEQVGVILRSRFLLQGDSETISRSRLERRLRDEGRNELTASQLATVARGHGCAALSAALERLPALPMGSVGAAQWREFWEAALSVLGWPGEGSLDSTEYQAREAWDRLLGTWGQLGTVRGPLPEDTAFASLSALAREVPFQPESDDVPIQVLGMLEAAGMEFEGIWIAGLDANAWPAAPRPQPFLPIAWQRRVGLPRATAESELHFARTLMQGYARCTRELKASYARQVGDEVCLPSPLIPAIAESAPPPRGEGDAQRMLDSRRLEPRSADAGIPLQLPQALKGGARLFEAQAACPFRAYGWFRLRAEGWPAVQHGITPSERGRFVHDALERFWKTTKTHAELVALRDRGALHDTLEACVETTLQQGGSPRWRALPPFVRDAERSALQRVLAEWLAVEAERAPFTVEGVEERLPVSIAGVEVQVKLDRIDRNAQGERILIDYKTGQPKSVQALFGPRPDAPQLPLYSCALGAQPPDVVAFGYVRRGQAEAVGVSRDVYDWSKVKAAQKLSRLSGAADWEALLALWRGALEGLAAAYAGGTAEVAPKRYPQTCGICDLRPLCRVSESRGADADQGDEDA